MVVQQNVFYTRIQQEYLEVKLKTPIASFLLSCALSFHIQVNLEISPMLFVWDNAHE